MHGYFSGSRACFPWLSNYGYGGYIMMAIGLVLILVLAYAVFRKGGIGASGISSSESPLDQLQRRYVNGDISKEEYQEKKEILKQK